MRWLLLTCVLGGCIESPSHDEPVTGQGLYGEYDVHREVTRWAICPDFYYNVSPDDFTMALDVDSATVSIEGALLDYRPSATGALFTVEEHWGPAGSIPADYPPSLDPNVAYTLELGGNQLVGTASSSFPFDTLDAGTNCDYEWRVTATRRL